MTITVATPVSGPHIADGVNRDWQFDWTIFDDDDVYLFITDSDGTNSEVVSLGYTVDPTYVGPGTSGGYVNYPTAPVLALESGKRVYVVRKTPYDQPNPIGNRGSFLAKDHENTFDRLAMQIQQLKADLDRAVLAQIGEAGLTLPPYSAGAPIGWDGSERALANLALSSGAVTLPLTARRWLRVNDAGTAISALGSTESLRMDLHAYGYMQYRSLPQFLLDTRLSNVVAADKIAAPVGTIVYVDDVPLQWLDPGEADFDLQTAGLVKFRVLPVAAGYYRWEAFGLDAANAAALNDAIFTKIIRACKRAGTSRSARGYAPVTYALNGFTIDGANIELYGGPGVVLNFKSPSSQIGIRITATGVRVCGPMTIAEDVPAPHNGSFDGGGIVRATIWVEADDFEASGLNFYGTLQTAIGTKDANMRVIGVKGDARHAGNTFTNPPPVVNLPAFIWCDVGGTRGKCVVANCDIKRYVEGVQIGNYGGGTTYGGLIIDNLWEDMSDHCVYANVPQGGVICIGNRCINSRFAIAVSGGPNVVSGNIIVSTSADPTLTQMEAGIHMRDAWWSVCSGNSIIGVSASIDITSVLTAFGRELKWTTCDGNIVHQTAESDRTGSAYACIRVANGLINNVSQQYLNVAVTNNDIVNVQNFLEQDAPTPDSIISTVATPRGAIDIRGNSVGPFQLYNAVVRGNRVRNTGGMWGCCCNYINGLLHEGNIYDRAEVPGAVKATVEVHILNCDNLVSRNNWYKLLQNSPNMQYTVIRTEITTGVITGEIMQLGSFTLSAKTFFSLSAGTNQINNIRNILHKMADVVTILTGATAPAGAAAIVNDNFATDGLVEPFPGDANGARLIRENGVWCDLSVAGQMTPRLQNGVAAVDGIIGWRVIK